MKKRIIYLLTITLLALILIAASSPREKVGERLFIPEGTGTMYYNEYWPFHLAHGWRSKIDAPVKSTSRGGLRVEIDGVEVPHDFIEYSRIEENGDTYLLKWFVFNFPTGMEGTHIFDLYYSNTCSIMLEVGGVTECDKPNSIVEVHYKSWEVIFQIPIFVVYKPGAVEGYQWPLGHPISLNINNGEYMSQSISEARPDFPDGDTRVLFEPWRDDFSIETGDYVVLTDEVTGRTKEHLVTSVEVTGFDINAETISGVYDPAYDLEVLLVIYDNTFPLDIIPPNEILYSGTGWTAYFDDVELGMTGIATQSDSDFDGTSWDFEVPFP